jgi:glucose/arabinose dehydrogenase
LQIGNSFSYFFSSKIKPTVLKYFQPALLICLFFISCNQSERKEAKPLAYLELENSALIVEEVTDSLGVPWDVDASIPGKLWFTEQSGSVYRLDLETLEKTEVLRIQNLLYKKSYGLLGMAVHPDESSVFLHYTFQSNKDDLQQEVQSRIVRYSFEGDTLINPEILLDSIPGNTYHNGSRLIISPDEKLFFSMGDAGSPDQTQNDSTLIGKILRLNLDGSIPDDNPIPGSPIWSRGHRNPQGLAFSDDGTFYSTEHGPNNDDEINLIEKNANYGWPDVHGFCDEDFEQTYCEEHQINEPLMSWTPTIAIAGLAYFNNSSIPEWGKSLIAANMKGRALRVLNLSDDGHEITDEHIYLQKEFGRIRDVSTAPDGAIYFSTSNTDWHPRFQPWMYDQLPKGGDRIIRIRALEAEEDMDESLPFLEENHEPLDLLSEEWNHPVNEQEFAAGQTLYVRHCQVCHGPEGQGSVDMYPPLANTDWVTGDKTRLIRTILLGLSEPIEVNGEMYNQEMPAFQHLSDQEVADILTYIRNSFGNSAGAVIPGEVFEERKSLE